MLVLKNPFVCTENSVQEILLISVQRVDFSTKVRYNVSTKWKGSKNHGKKCKNDRWIQKNEKGLRLD